MEGGREGGIDGRAPDGDLVGYWTFDEGTGTTAADSSGNNRNATLFNGVAWVPGKHGMAVSFDGFDDRAEILALNSPAFPLSGTISLWFKGALADQAGKQGWLLDVYADFRECLSRPQHRHRAARGRARQTSTRARPSSGECSRPWWTTTGTTPSSRGTPSRIASSTS